MNYARARTQNLFCGAVVSALESQWRGQRLGSRRSGDGWAVSSHRATVHTLAPSSEWVPSISRELCPCAGSSIPVSLKTSNSRMTTQYKAFIARTHELTQSRMKQLGKYTYTNSICQSAKDGYMKRPDVKSDIN